MPTATAAERRRRDVLLRGSIVRRSRARAQEPAGSMRPHADTHLGQLVVRHPIRLRLPCRRLQLLLLLLLRLRLLLLPLPARGLRCQHRGGAPERQATGGGREKAGPQVLRPQLAHGRGEAGRRRDRQAREDE